MRSSSGRASGRSTGGGGSGRRSAGRLTAQVTALGIETGYQDLALADNLDVVQNMFLGRERPHRWLLDEDEIRLRWPRSTDVGYSST
jgi:ABC-type sugar transport system ATPase subunit